jgi:dTDP-4-amino-4,6-dideoxygalactose transaminase
MHSQPCYGTKTTFPNTEKLYGTGVCLPSAPSLTDENVAYICDAIRSFYARNAQ